MEALRAHEGKGEARSENTGSVSQNCWPSLSSRVEWPSRHRLMSGAASSSAWLSACTGIGRAGTLSAGLPNRKRHITAAVFSAPMARRGTG
jgi:hypothetical protein